MSSGSSGDHTTQREPVGICTLASRLGWLVLPRLALPIRLLHLLSGLCLGCSACAWACGGRWSGDGVHGNSDDSCDTADTYLRQPWCIDNGSRLTAAAANRLPLLPPVRYQHDVTLDGQHLQIGG